jgi:hypothetical protein
LQPATDAPLIHSGPAAPTFKRTADFDFAKYDVRPEYGIAGRIISANQQPIPGAQVTIYRTRSLLTDALEDPLANASSDDTGHYALRIDSPVTAWVGIRKEGYAQVDGRLDLRSMGVATRNYTLREAKSGIQGQVSERGGKALPDAWVTVVPSSPEPNPNGSSTGVRVARTDRYGRFSIAELSSEAMTVVAFTPRHFRQSQTVQLKPEDTTRVDFELTPAATLALTIRNRRGAAVPLATASAPHGSARSDDRGVAVLTIPFGARPFDCSIVAGGYKPVTLPIDPNSPPPIVVLDDADAFAGRILSETGTPVPGATVQVYPSDDEVTTDSGGLFSVRVPFPPVRQVSVTKRGFVSETVTYDKGMAPEFAEIRLRRVDGGIYGRVLDTAGKPVSRFSIVLWDLSPAPKPPFGRFFDNEEGLFSITEVPAGWYRLVVNSAGDSGTNGAQSWELKRIEFRRGLFFGEVVAQFGSAAP